MKYILIITLLLTSLFANQTNFKISYDPNYAPFSYNQDEKPEVYLLIFGNYGQNIIIILLNL
jgi:hypothetical protein